MIRTSLWITVALLAFGAVGVPTARADTYQYTLTFSPASFNGESTPVVFNTNGAFNFNTLYTPISGNAGTSPIDFGGSITGIIFQNETTLDVTTAHTAGGWTIEPISAITTGSEAITGIRRS